MMVASKTEDNRMCQVAVLALSLMHAFSNIAQIHSETGGFSESITHREAPLFIIWLIVSLSPIPALFLLRRSCVLLGIMAVPIAAIFCGRIYYGWLFLNSGHLVQKGDWAIWANSFFGLISVVIVATWIMVCAIAILVDFISCAIRNSKR